MLSPTYPTFFRLRYEAAHRVTSNVSSGGDGGRTKITTSRSYLASSLSVGLLSRI